MVQFAKKRKQMEETGLRELSKALPINEESPVVHVEICQSPTSVASPEVVMRCGAKVLAQLQDSYIVDEVTMEEFEDPQIVEHVAMVTIGNVEYNKATKDHLLKYSEAQFMFHVYQLHEDSPTSEELEEEEHITAAHHWLLPSVEFQGLWESLVFDCDIKEKLLQYARTTLLFSDREVNCNIVSWNRVILLHGPPGTGKTSLCKALAQKLCIRFSDRYCYGELVEINSHSLFSKWFSESGKLVQKMFSKIHKLIDDQDSLVCVLIDEVESLTAARKSAMSGSEPSDAIRVVNAVLTQIDQIKRCSNVIILTTSNITEAIDLAFVDRADLKQYIGLPSMAAVYKIYHSCINELVRARIIAPGQQILELRALEVMRFIENDATKLSLKLRDIATKSVGFSGRSLRKMPFLAHTLHHQIEKISMEMFLTLLDKAVVKRKAEEAELAASQISS